MSEVDLSAIFCPARLRIARSFIGITQTQLAEKVGVGQQFIARLERGQKEPNEILAAAISEALGFEVAFFYGEALDEFKDTECAFRRRATMQIGVRTRALAYGTLFGQLVAHLSGLVRLPKLNLPSIEADTNEQIDRAALRCRLQWQLEPNLPIGNMVQLSESIGVPVAKFEGLGEKLDAFSYMRVPNVIVLTDKPSSRCRWDVAHELGHLVLHHGKVTGTKETEAQANRFAAAFLLPVEFVRAFRRNMNGVWKTLFELKQIWKVSLGAMIRCAHERNIISAIQYVRLYKELSARGWLKHEPHEFEAEQPQMIKLAFEKVQEFHALSPDDVREQLAWKQSTFSLLTGITAPVSEPSVRAKVLPFVRV